MHCAAFKRYIAIAIDVPCVRGRHCVTYINITCSRMKVLQRWLLPTPQCQLVVCDLVHHRAVHTHTLTASVPSTSVLLSQQVHA
jgi:hypothetical protein